MLLSLDSSTRTLSLALLRWEGGETVLTRDIDDGGQHGHSLPSAIDALLREAGASLASLRGCAVGLGPGSFTGLRVGMATLKGLCYARHLPLAGASSLRALALGAASRAAEGEILCALLDARRGELYAGLFRGPAAEPLGAERALPPAELAGWLAGAPRVRLFGEGLLAQRAAIEAAWREGWTLDFDAPPTPKGAQVGRLTGPPAEGRPEALFALEPRYVRPSEAELKHPDGTFKPHPTAGSP
ncbi:MAG: tRNA (adenosine(37)-N6)-threonylcarbamoyltransferase complex dimerization subunit type 1 TsaB [Myxococcales bacterium]